MASHKAFVDYITEQLGGAGEIRAKTMFGEYGLYCDGQFFAVICEDQLFLKCTPQGEAAFPHLPKAPPYPGARDSLLVEDVEDRALLVRLTQITCAALADQPKKARRKQPMPIDYKKTQKALYRPPKTPHLIQVPPLSFLAVQGQGDPNQPGGAYQEAIGQLYAVAFTLKMSKLGPWQPAGYFDYVMPPLEGLWWMPDGAPMDFTRKDTFHWISLLRLPEFATREVFQWAVQEAERNKKRDLSSVTFFPYAEGLCVQCLHQGPYDSEPETLQAMVDYADAQGYRLDQDGPRHHHEIYLSDPRRCKPENQKTVLRLPVKPK